MTLEFGFEGYYCQRKFTKRRYGDNENFWMIGECSLGMAVWQEQLVYSEER